MISCTEFIPLYSEFFKFLEKRGGHDAVMAGHIPFVTSVKSCDCKIEFDDGSEKIGRTDGGLLTVSSDKTTLLSGSFSWK